MDKFLTRMTIVIVTLYFFIAYAFAQFGIDILTNSYVLLFELCVVAYTFCSGKFHCQYIRWTALGLFVIDVLNHSDYYFNYIPVSVFNIIPIAILSLSIGITLSLAIYHFYKVTKIKNKKGKMLL